MRVLVITPPAPVIGLAQVKEHLRVRSDDEDALITRLITAATGHIDGPAAWLGRAIGIQTLELRLDHFTANACRYDIRLPYEPIISVTSVKYMDGSGTEQTVDASAYELLGNEIALAFGQSWPSARRQNEAIRIRYQAGYAEVPEPIIAAILLMVGDLWANRQTAVTTSATSVPMSTTVENLLAPYRVFA